MLIDGHNRYAIAQAHGLPYRTISMDFEDEIDVEIWIRSNQKGRRNFTREEQMYNIGKLYELTKMKHGGERGNQYTKQAEVASDKNNTEVASGQNVHLPPESSKTAEKIAVEQGVDEKTVRRAAEYARALDTLAEGAPEVKDKVLAGEVKANQKDVVAVARMEPEKRAAIAQKIATGEAATVTEAIRKAKGNVTSFPHTMQ